MTPAELTDSLGVGVALIASVGLPLWFNRRKERAAAVTKTEKSDANLRDDQREFIQVLQRENSKWRQEVDALHDLVDQLRLEIETLRSDLANERRARESSEARIAVETETRTQLTEQRIAGATAAAATHAEGERPNLDAGRLTDQQEAGRPTADE